jgi:uncharacterized protein (DUF58 family)
VRKVEIGIGWALSAWLIASVLIALNRGVDLLWGMVTLLSSALVTAWCLPRLQVQRLSVRRRFPEAAVSGEAVELEYEITVAGWLPCFGILLSDRAGDSQALVPVAYFGMLRGRSVHRLRWSPPVRGIRMFDAVLVESGFPLALSRASRQVDAGTHKMIVYPGRTRLHDLPLDASPDSTAAISVAGRRGARDEFFGVRQYQPGDDPRSVHWRVTARTGQLVVREFERPPDRRLWIILELDANSHAGRGSAGSHERMFRIANSVAWRATEDAVAVGLLWREYAELRRVDATAGTAAYMRIRETLATVPLISGDPIPDWLPVHEKQLPRGGEWLVFNPCGAGRRDSLIRVARSCGARLSLIEFEEQVREVGRFGAAVQPIRTVYRGEVRAYIVPNGADLGRLFASVP